MTEDKNVGSQYPDSPLPTILTTEDDVGFNIPTDTHINIEGDGRTETAVRLNTEGDGRVDTEMDLITEPETPAALLQKHQVKGL